MPILADITIDNPVVNEILHHFDHPTIPYYMVIPPEGPILYLDEVITPGQVVAALEKSQSAGAKVSLR